MEVTKPTRRKSQFKQLLENPETFASVLLVIALDEYGPESLKWHPTTLRLELEDDFDAKLPDQNLSKLAAAITVLTTDQFFNNLPSFIELTNAFADSNVETGTFDIATCDEMAWAITEALLIYPPEKGEGFSAEIRAYIGHMLDEEGFVNPPDVLQIGTRRRDPLNDFSDDPAMYAAIYESQDRKTQELREQLQFHLYHLISQLQAMLLKNGDTSKVIARMRAAITS